MAIDADLTLTRSNSEQDVMRVDRVSSAINRTPETVAIAGNPELRATKQQTETRTEAASIGVHRATSAASGSAAGDAPGDDRLNTRINDEHFMHDLVRLKELRSFLMQEAVDVRPADAGALEFGQLNLLRRNHLADNMGRDPTADEWSQVERHTQALFGLLTPALRRRFVHGAIPSMLAWLPLCLALTALAALILAIVSGNLDLLRMGSFGADVLPFYLVWLMSLGAIGATAYIGMNALSGQEDIAFDLTNRRLLVMRIALGALFGLVLTLPFGFQDFLNFCRTIVHGNLSQAGDAAPTVAIQATMLVLPFVLGFSTSLIILVLNRLVDAVQGFFGRKADAAAATAAARA